MLRTHSSSHTLILCLALAVVSAACSSSGDSNPAPADTDLDVHGERGGGTGSAGAGSEAEAGTGSVASAGEAGASSEPPGSAGSAASQANGGGGKSGGGKGGGKSSESGGSESGGSENGGSANAGASGSASHLDPAVVRGQALAKKNMCTTCHQQDYSGLAIYANITPDLDTGIGSWSDQEISDAVRVRKGKGDATLCNLMVPFPFSDAEIADLIAFLRSLPPVSNQIEETCPGHVAGSRL